MASIHSTSTWLCAFGAIVKTLRGALEHVIAGKTTAFTMGAAPQFVERQARCIDGAKIIAARLSQLDAMEAGISGVTGAPTFTWRW